MKHDKNLNIKFGFSLLIKFSPLYFQKTYHLLNLRGILQQKPMKIMTSLLIHIVIILCFTEHLCYQQGPAEMFGNVFILMECYLRLGPDVDHSDFTCYVCCFQTGWHCFQTLLVFRSKNRSLNACIEYKNWKDSFANQCSLDIYVYKHKTVL